MKTIHKGLKAILCFAILVLSCIAGTASASLFTSPADHYKPTDNTVGNMSVKDARKILTSEMKGEGKFVYYDEKNHKITNVHAYSNKLIVIDENGKRSVIMYKACLSG